MVGAECIGGCHCGWKAVLTMTARLRGHGPTHAAVMVLMRWCRLGNGPASDTKGETGVQWGAKGTGGTKAERNHSLRV